MTTDLRVRRREFGGCVIVACYAAVDVQWMEQLHTGSSAMEGGHLVLDLRHARGLQAAAAPSLAALCRHVHATGGTVCIVTADRSLRSTVSDAALGSLPRFYDDIGDALEASLVSRAERVP